MMAFAVGKTIIQTETGVTYVSKKITIYWDIKLRTLWVN